MKSRFIDYKLKAKVIKSGVAKTISKVDCEQYLFDTQGIIPSCDLDELYTDCLFNYGFDYIKEARKINIASFRRVERLKARIASYLLKGQCIWATLTFNDEILASTSIETRRKYVSRYLKSVSDCYVANIDFGKQNEREHYHALVLVDRISEKWDYGFTWFEKVHCINSDKNLAKYISKLTNHAIKETTKRSCYIYSRRS